MVFLYGYMNRHLSLLGDAYESWEVAKAFFDPAYQYRSMVLFFLAVFFVFALDNFFREYRNKYDGTFVGDPGWLIRSQLLHSLEWQKVEWNAGDIHYPGTLVFLDLRSQIIMVRENIDIRLGYLPISQYLDLIKKYPIDFFTKYVRQFFSGLDIVYPEIYIRDLHQGRVLFSFVNYTLIFAALMVVIDTIIKRSRAIGIWAAVLLSLTFPALISIPFIIETRFFFSMLLTFCALAIFNTQIPKGCMKTLFADEKYYWPMLAYVFLSPSVLPCLQVCLPNSKAK